MKNNSDKKNIDQQNTDSLSLELAERSKTTSKVVFVNDSPESLAWISLGLNELKRRQSVGDIPEYFIDLVVPRLGLAKIYANAGFFRDVFTYNSSDEESREKIFQAVKENYSSQDHFIINSRAAQNSVRFHDEHWINAYTALICGKYPEEQDSVPVFRIADSAIGSAVSELMKSASIGQFHGHHVFILSFDINNGQANQEPNKKAIRRFVAYVTKQLKLPVFVWRKGVPPSLFSEISNYVHFVNPSEIWELAYYIASSRVVVCNEGWPAHFAAAFRRWQYVLYSAKYKNDREKRQYRTPIIKYLQLPNKAVPFEFMEENFSEFANLVSDYKNSIC